MELKVLNDDNEELRNVKIPDLNFLLVCNDQYGGEPRHYNNFEYLRLDDKNVIKQSYVKAATDIRDKYSSLLSHVYPRNIMFHIDESWEPTEKTSENSRWKIDIIRASGGYKTFGGFDYMMKMRKHWLEKWTDAQLHAAILSQLLRINRADGSILKYTEDHNSRMVATFGARYLEPGTVIADILQEDVKIRDYRQASGQITMDELDSDGQPADEAEEPDQDEEGTEEVEDDDEMDSSDAPDDGENQVDQDDDTIA